MSESFPHHHRRHTTRKQESLLERENRENRLADITHERKLALKRIFGKDMELFTFPEDTPQGIKATDVFHGLFNHIFDAGTNRDVACDIQVGKKTVHISEFAVPIHSRSSLITYSMGQIEQGKCVEFGMIDLQNLRNADFELDKTVDKGTHSADIIINKTARVIRKTLKEVWGELFGSDYSENLYEVGRYGGDEFIIALFGDKAIESKEGIIQRIQQELMKEKGYYKSHGEVVELPIQLKKVDKDGSIGEWLRPPDSGPEREIYLEFLQRGTLFGTDEFKRLISKYSPKGMLDMDLYRKDYPKKAATVIYPSAIEDNLKSKIKYIKENHPELVIPFEFAEKYDMEDSSGTGDIELRQKSLLRIIENSIFDRLLGNMVYSKAHFGSHMRTGELQQVYIEDFKFLKEINTGMTYADADIEIRRLWEHIQSTLPESDRKKIIISRFAGAFYIGVRRGEHVTATEGLREMKTHRLFDSMEELAYSVPLGYAHKRIYPHQNHIYYKVISDSERESDRYFYTELTKDIIKSSLDDPSFLDAMMAVNIDELESRDYTVLSKPELYTLLLKGKRKEARIGRLKEVIDECVINQMQQFMDKQRYPSQNVQQYIYRVREIRNTLLQDLEESLGKPAQEYSV